MEVGFIAHFTAYISYTIMHESFIFEFLKNHYFQARCLLPSLHPIHLFDIICRHLPTCPKLLTFPSCAAPSLHKWWVRESVPAGTSEKTDDEVFFFASFPFPSFPHFRLGLLITFPGAASFHIFPHLPSLPSSTISEDLEKFRLIRKASSYWIALRPESFKQI